MSSRMSKYYEEDTEMPTRYHRNEDLYKEINKNEIDNFEIKSNSTLLGENKDEIDVEKIKKILDTKYKEATQRKSIRDTQFDILRNLNVEEKENDDDEIEEDDDTTTSAEINKDSLEEENLKSLINTIAFNEHKNKEYNNSLDILSDLKGDDNTEVLDGLKEEITKQEN